MPMWWTPICQSTWIQRHWRGLAPADRVDCVIDLLPARCRAHPVGHRRAVEFDAFARVDLRLAVERKVVGVLRNQHMRQQAGAGCMS
jgi:hypothetical protein